MNHTQAAVKLLAHGPLTFVEFVEITGWPKHQCRSAIQQLILHGRISFTRQRGFCCYRLGAAVLRPECVEVL